MSGKAFKDRPLLDRVRMIDSTVLSDDWAVLSKYTFDYQHRGGEWERQDREIYHRGDSIAVLPYDPDRGTVLLLRQFRLAAALTDSAGQIIEACAGAVEDEAIDATVHREALEELGYRLHDLRPACKAYSSPGSMTERIFCFTARYTPQDKVEDGGGRTDEGEDIEVIEMTLDSAFAMIATGEIMDAKTILLLQHLKLSTAG